MSKTMQVRAAGAMEAEYETVPKIQMVPFPMTLSDH